MNSIGSSSTNARYHRTRFDASSRRESGSCTRTFIKRKLSPLQLIDVLKQRLFMALRVNFLIDLPYHAGRTNHELVRSQYNARASKTCRYLASAPPERTLR